MEAGFSSVRTYVTYKGIFSLTQLMSQLRMEDMAYNTYKDICMSQSHKRPRLTQDGTRVVTAVLYLQIYPSFYRSLLKMVSVF